MKISNFKIIGPAILALLIIITISSLAIGLPFGSPQDGEKPVEKKKQLTTDEFAAALVTKEAELNRRDQELSRREQTVVTIEEDLKRRLSTLEQNRKEFLEETAKFGADKKKFLDEQQSDRLRKLVSLFASMKAAVSGTQLWSLYLDDPRTAMFVMHSLDQTSLSKILVKMEKNNSETMLKEYNSWQILVTKGEADQQVKF
jgi:flagellar motility protein MotE (MotC chaperone)